MDTASAVRMEDTLGDIGQKLTACQREIDYDNKKKEMSAELLWSCLETIPHPSSEGAGEDGGEPSKYLREFGHTPAAACRFALRGDY